MCAFSHMCAQNLLKGPDNDTCMDVRTLIVGFDLRTSELAVTNF